VVRKIWRGKIVCFEVTFEGVKRQVYDSRFEAQQGRKHDVQNRFLPWALGGETDWRNAANDWVDGKV